VHRQKRELVAKYSARSPRQWEEKPCYSHQECRARGTGAFCCAGSCCQEEGDYSQDYYDEEYLTLVTGAGGLVM
jgi:hypothetical protein